MRRLDSVYKGLTHVREAQVVQERLDRIVIRVVPAPGFGDAEASTLRDNMRLHMGELDIRVETVAEIERTAAGKFPAVVCKLSAQERAAALAKRMA